MDNTENTTQACLHCHGNGELVYDSTVSDSICQLCGKWQKSTPLDDFAGKAYALISQLDTLVKKTLKNNGDTSEKCQLMNLVNLIQQLEYAVNGTEESDLMNNSLANIDNQTDVSGGNKSLTLIFTCDDGVTFDVKTQNVAYDFFNQKGVDVTRFNEEPTKDIANKVFSLFIQENQLWLSQIFDVDSMTALTFEFVGHQNSTKKFTSTTALLSFSRT